MLEPFVNQWYCLRIDLIISNEEIMPGQDLVDAIKANAKLTKIAQCPKVPIKLSEAIYGVVKNDDTVATDLNFNGDQTQAELWHVSLSSDTLLHHFAVLVWKNDQDVVGCTLFMAYETKYTLGQYVSGKSKKQGMIGYVDFMEMTDFKTMMKSLSSEAGAWGKRFNVSDFEKATSCKIYKYGQFDLTQAVQNVAGYNPFY